jgi:hypothetical protein
MKLATRVVGSPVRDGFWPPPGSRFRPVVIILVVILLVVVWAFKDGHHR